MSDFDGGREKWAPPPWHAPRSSSDPGRRGSSRPPSGPGSERAGGTTPQPPGPRPQPIDPDRPTVLGFSIAPGVTGLLAIALVFVRPLNNSSGLPLALLLICVVQTVVYLIMRRSEVEALSRSWLIVLLMTAGLLPLLALQSDLLREPYTSASRGGTGPVLLANGTTVLFLLVVAVWSLIAHATTSELSSIAFLPLALLVPAALGVQSTIEQREALEVVGEAALFAAGATLLAWSMPRGARLIVPPIAFLIQFIALWTAGRGPTFPNSSGALVDLLYWLTLIITGVITLTLPIASSWLRRTIARVEEEDRGRRQATSDRRQATETK
jgi:hypothetical protein